MCRSPRLEWTYPLWPANDDNPGPPAVVLLGPPINGGDDAGQDVEMESSASVDSDVDEGGDEASATADGHGFEYHFFSPGVRTFKAMDLTVWRMTPQLCVRQLQLQFRGAQQLPRRRHQQQWMVLQQRPWMQQLMVTVLVGFGFPPSAAWN